MVFIWANGVQSLRLLSVRRGNCRVVNVTQIPSYSTIFSALWKSSVAASVLALQLTFSLLSQTNPETDKERENKWKWLYAEDLEWSEVCIFSLTPVMFVIKVCRWGRISRHQNKARTCRTKQENNATQHNYYLPMCELWISTDPSE